MGRMLKKIFSLHNVWYFLISFTAFRLFYLTVNFRPLNVDEAQYWLWAQHLSWGYHSKPPLIAWVVSLVTHIFGNGYFGVRCVVPIVWLVTVYVLYLIAKKIFNRDIARWTAVSFFFMPSVVLSSTVISVDPLMMMFWVCGLYFLIYALERGNLFYWLLLGVAVGLSALVKYTGLFFLLFLFLYLIFDRELRPKLKSYKLYLMLVMILLVLLPNIIWNIQHGFAAVKHVVYHNVGIHGFNLHPMNMVGFLLSQLGVFTIIFLPIYLYCIFRKKYWQDKWWRLLWWFSLPMLVIILLESLFSRAYANWAATAYLAGTILVVAILVKNQAYRWLKINLGYCVLVMLAFYVVDFGVSHNLMRLSKYPHVYRTSFGWEQVGKKIKLLVKRYPNANFVINNREIWAKSVYYAKLPLNKVYIWDNSDKAKLEIFTSWDQAKHQDFIWLSFNQGVSDSMQRSFKKIIRLQPIGFNHPRSNYRNIYVYYLIDFQGRSK
jgi:4-amino-4-deoxy-L-arabinose transferase-like glycosyltransferase